MKKSIILLTGILGLALLAFAIPTRADEEGKKVTITGPGLDRVCRLIVADVPEARFGVRVKLV